MDHNILFPGATPARLPLEHPMPQLGVWRCGKKHMWNSCCHSTCKSDPEKTTNGCLCHEGKQCRVQDQQATRLTPYEQAPPSQRALKHARRVEQEDRYVASYATSVSISADSMKASCVTLADNLASLDNNFNELVESLEKEQEHRGRTLHIGGFTVQEIRDTKHKAADDAERATEEAEIQIQTLTAHYWNNEEGKSQDEDEDDNEGNGLAPTDIQDEQEVQQQPPEEQVNRREARGQEGHGLPQPATHSSGGGQLPTPSPPPGQNKVRQTEGQHPQKQVEVNRAAGLQRQSINTHIKDIFDGLDTQLVPGTPPKRHYSAATDAGSQRFPALRTRERHIAWHTDSTALARIRDLPLTIGTYSLRPQPGILPAYRPQLSTAVVVTGEVPHLGARSRPQHPTAAETSHPAPPQELQE